MSGSTGGEFVMVKPDRRISANVIEIWVKCPMCEEKWKFRGTTEPKEKLRDAVGGPVSVLGPDGRQYRGTKLETSRWGPHALCGTCRAKRAARVVEKILPNKVYVLSYPWKEEDEKQMYGRLRHQQDRYAAFAILIGPWSPEVEMIDQQKSRCAEIMATNPIYISRERVAMLGLDWKEDF